MVPIDPNLLGNARAAAAKVIEADKELQVAKAEYHAEVRRLHLAGASLREIAAALGISHQRVQQIVDDAGGSWWTKVWRNRASLLRDTRCSFCTKTRAEVDKLISGPDLFICDGCVKHAERVVKTRAAHAAFHLVPATDRAKCSFCGERQGANRKKPSAGASDEPRGMVTGASRHVCTECLRLCRGILDETA